MGSTLLLLLLAIGVSADWPPAGVEHNAATQSDTWTVPSHNLNAAFELKWYKSISGQQGAVAGSHWPAGMGQGVLPGEGVHGVHGVETSDGGLVACGVWSITNDFPFNDPTQNMNGDGFVVKTDKDGKLIWSWISGWTNDNDGALAVAQIPGGGDILVGMASQQVVGNQKLAWRRTLVRLNLVTGALVWSAQLPDPTGTGFSCTPDSGEPTCSGAIYWLSTVTGPAGHEGIVASGFVHKNNPSDVAWKSGGNPSVGGKGFVMKISLAALVRDTSPTEADVQWLKAFAGTSNGVSVRALPDGGAVVLLQLDGADEGAEGEFTAPGSGAQVGPTAQMPEGIKQANGGNTAVARIDSSGNVVWGPTAYDRHGEASDIAVVLDATGALQSFAISGHYTRGMAWHYYLDVSCAFLIEPARAPQPCARAHTYRRALASAACPARACLQPPPTSTACLRLTRGSS